MALYELRKFVAPEFIFGVGARHRVAYYAQHFGARRVLVVTDPGVVAAGWLDDLSADLEAAGLAYTVYRGVTANPRDHEVMTGAELYREAGCDVIVAVGGGSVIDCAKGIGIVSSNQRHILDFEGVDRVEVPGPPLICIPTTAGTSADISQFAIITNPEARTKIAIISKSVVPDVALVDPETTLTMDVHLTASTGIDAMVHAIEAFVSTASSPVIDVHALQAIRLIRRHLPDAIAHPDDLELREQMMLASLQAGLAFSNASLGAVHALAHSLGGFLDLPHGESNALLLEHVMRFNFDAAPQRYAAIGEALGVDLRGMAERARREAILADVAALRRAAGLHDTLGSKGVRSGDVADLARFAVKDPCIVTNPRPVQLRDAQIIYEEAI